MVESNKGCKAKLIQHGALETSLFLTSLLVLLYTPFLFPPTHFSRFTPSLFSSHPWSNFWFESLFKGQSPYSPGGSSYFDVECALLDTPLNSALSPYIAFLFTTWPTRALAHTSKGMMVCKTATVCKTCQPPRCVFENRHLRLNVDWFHV